MKALVYRRFGDPSVLRVEDVPMPQVGPREVLVRVGAAAMNPKDVLVRKGKFKVFSGQRFPRGVGWDFAGTVEAVGRDVVSLAPGHEVFGMLNRWDAGACAEFVAAPLDEVARSPRGLSQVLAASIPLAGLTALQALRDEGELAQRGRGAHVLVHGASGGVGVHAIQIAKAFGALVTTTSSAANVDLCRSLGADDPVAYEVEDPLRTHGPYDVIFDVFGNRNFREAAPALRHGGTFVSTVPSIRIVQDRLATHFQSRRARLVVVRSNARDLAALATMVEDGRLRPVVDRTYPLHEAHEAHRYLETKRARGKVVITIAR